MAKKKPSRKAVIAPVFGAGAVGGKTPNPLGKKKGKKKTAKRKGY